MKNKRKWFFRICFAIIFFLICLQQILKFYCFVWISHYFTFSQYPFAGSLAFDVYFFSWKFCFFLRCCFVMQFVSFMFFFFQKLLLNASLEIEVKCSYNCSYIEQHWTNECDTKQIIWISIHKVKVHKKQNCFINHHAVWFVSINVFD